MWPIQRDSSGQPRFAGFWIRFLAAVIDNIVLNLAAWLLEFMVVGAVFWMAKAMGRELTINALIEQVVAVVCYLILCLVYYTVAHARYGMTLGKWPLGIRVVDARSLRPIGLGQSLIRTLAYALSYLPLGAGFIMAAFNPRKQGLHDVIANTVSVISRGGSAEATAPESRTSLESGVEGSAGPGPDSAI